MERLRISATVALALVSAALFAVALVLPWRRPLGSPEVALPEPPLEPRAALILLVPAAAMVATLVCTLLRRPRAALAAMIIAVVTMTAIVGTTRGEALWEGADAQGRPIGGGYLLGPGPGAFCALASTLPMLVLVILGPRLGRGPGPTPRAGTGGRPQGRVRERPRRAAYGDPAARTDNRPDHADSRLG